MDKLTIQKSTTSYPYTLTLSMIFIITSEAQLNIKTNIVCFQVNIILEKLVLCKKDF